MAQRSKRPRNEAATGSDLPPKKLKVEREEEDTDQDFDSDGLGDLSQMGTQDEKESSLSTVTEADVGVIEKIQLINFMCHKRLDIELCPNINFVLGRNGSGKSAIMTAVVVALGGKARNTERGSSLKQFIKSGERSAEVVVTLRNRGPETEAFKQDKYGRAITVVRTVNVDGTGSYKIKGERGNVVSTKKEELVSMLDHFNVQIDNPVSILNQDTSRNFLHNSTPAAKYKLFMKATHLEQIAQDYEKAEEHQRLMSDGINRQKELLPALQKTTKELEEKVDSFDRLKDMESKVIDLEKELLWAQVIEIESTIPPVEDDIKAARTRITRNEQRVKKAENDVATQAEKVRVASKELDKVVKEASEVHKQREVVTMERRAKEKELRECGGNVKRLNREIKDCESEKNVLVKTLEEKIAASQRDIAGEKEERRVQLEKYMGQLKKLEGELTTAENDRVQFESAIATCKADMDEHNGKVRGCENTIQESENQLRQLQSSRSDKLAAFGPQMRSLVNALQKNQHRFRHLPKGPIGAMINLREYKWSTAVEQAVKWSLLNAFVVDNEHDAATFKGIVRNVYQRGKKPECITSAFADRVYDVRRNRPNCSYPTILDILDVKDPDILNVLIDQCSVESMLLIERREEASHVMSRQRPQGARAAWTIEGDEVLGHAHYSNKRGKMNIIRASVDDAVSGEKYRLSELQGSLDQLNREGGELRDNHQRHQRHLAQIKQQIRLKMTKRNKLTMAITELQNAQEEEEPEVEDTATYEAEISELDEKIQSLEADREARLAANEELKKVLKESMEHSRQVDNEVERVAAKMEEAKAVMNQHSHVKVQAERKLQTCKDRVKDIQNNVAQLEKKISETKESAEAAARSASDVCDRVDTSRSCKNIESEISKLKRTILHQQPSHDEQESIRDQYAEAMEKVKSTQLAIKQERKALLVLRRNLKDRIGRYQGLQETIAKRACIYFTHFLNRRCYVGKLRFSHEKERLDIVVQVDKSTQQSQSTKNTKSLSGGERSFTTVCFIMSLWEAMEAPFRCLDEFDVFMDMMNRRISMSMMMDHAEEQPTRQFIFFTPQEMSNMGISKSDKMKVLKLREPERGLEPGQTTLD